MRALTFSIYPHIVHFTGEGMGARENLQKLADKKQAEVDQLERQIDDARVYLQAIQDSIRALPRDLPNTDRQSEEAVLRPGTALFRAKEAIEANGAPMHITMLLKVLGVENTKAARVSLVGSLGTYVRRNVIFTRPGPNIFGLVGASQTANQMDSNVSEQEALLPEDFGK